MSVKNSTSKVKGNNNPIINQITLKVIEDLKEFPESILRDRPNVKESLKSMHEEYVKLTGKAWDNIRKRRNLTDEMMIDALECGEADCPELQGFCEEWEDACADAMNKVCNKKHYKYWKLDLEHDDCGVVTIYWGGYYWIRFDGHEYTHEFIVEIEKAINKAVSEGMNVKS